MLPQRMWLAKKLFSSSFHQIVSKITTGRQLSLLQFRRWRQWRIHGRAGLQVRAGPVGKQSNRLAVFVGASGGWGDECPCAVAKATTTSSRFSAVVRFTVL